ncbi:MAG: efflux RND transporter periplasmic adaptor subunit [Pseudomonadales bacterium]
MRIFVVLFFASVFSHLCLADGQSRQRVEVRSIGHGVLQQEIRTFGVLAPGVEELSFQISGRIAAFNVQEGDEVKAGQLLAALDPQDAEDLLRRAENERGNGARLLERMKTLHAAGSIQASQLEDAQAQYDQLQIAFEQAQLNLARCQLVAPSDGLILKRTTDSRTSVTAGVPIFVFQSHEEAWVTEVHLTDKNALQVSNGTSALVRFAPYPDEVFEGRVTSVAQVANPGDGLFRAEIAIDRNGAALRPGMLAEIDLTIQSEEFYSSVPFDALLDVRGNRGVVYLLRASADSESTVIARTITIVSMRREWVTVAEDLTDFSTVVVRGHYGLSDGLPVLVTNSTQPDR